MLDRHISGLASWLSKPVGFLTTTLTVATGLGLGAVLSFNDHWALVFNLALSIGALLLAAIILVAGAKDTAALHAKLDEIVGAIDKADNRLIGIDQKSAEELEAIRAERPPHSENQAA